MKIFISWSGTRSREVATALQKWIHEVIQTTKLWMSEVSIPAGARWQNETVLHIQEADFGIICLTASNQHAPWLLFEAGALAKSIKASDNYVCPYLIDLDEVDVHRDSPLRQFQAKRADEQGTWKLIESIHRAMGDSPLSETQLRRSFDRWWPDLKSVLDNPANEIPRDTRSGIEVSIEQILVRHLSDLGSNLSSRLDDIERLLGHADRHHLGD